ncbi:FtsX-like permease family protein [Photobacterium sp.]|uniref:FtsX-like permease family protein n=1 Tax=Photobacterium sp. TaxID=660 RepID=UPI00299D94B5|nr:FtsX-like permease family protein [Photobacterium sp.]MDX1302111.1 FtsX-like permease family protein [Photobacterium sp.]
MGSLIFLLRLAKKYIIHNAGLSLFMVSVISTSGFLLLFLGGYGLNALEKVKESVALDNGSHLDFFEYNVFLVMNTSAIIITVIMYVLLQYIMINNISRRQREIDLLTILGANPREIIAGFFCEVSLIVIAGLSLGGGLAVWCSAIYLDIIVQLSQFFELHYLVYVEISSPLLLVLSVSIVIISISILSALIAVKRGVRKSCLMALNCQRL